MIEIKVKLLGRGNKTIGLINAPRAYPIMFKTRFGIHTFGLRFPIDVFILDRENKVVRIEENLKPYRFFFWNPRFDKVIELPAGEAKKLNIKLGNLTKIKSG